MWSSLPFLPTIFFAKKKKRYSKGCQVECYLNFYAHRSCYTNLFQITLQARFCLIKLLLFLVVNEAWDNILCSSLPFDMSPQSFTVLFLICSPHLTRSQISLSNFVDLLLYTYESYTLYCVTSITHRKRYVEMHACNLISYIHVRKLLLFCYQSSGTLTIVGDFLFFIIRRGSNNNTTVSYMYWPSFAHDLINNDKCVITCLYIIWWLFIDDKLLYDNSNLISMKKKSCHNETNIIMSFLKVYPIQNYLCGILCFWK